MSNEEGVGQHGQGHMAVQTIPASALIVVQAALAFGVFVELFDHPALMRQADQALPGNIGGQGADVPLGITTFPRQRAVAGCALTTASTV